MDRDPWIVDCQPITQDKRVLRGIQGTPYYLIGKSEIFYETKKVKLVRSNIETA